jgi:putative addiction module CopG family antidote
MPAKTALSVSLTSELGTFIADQVGSGRHGSANEVVCAALRLLARHEAGLAPFDPLRSERDDEDRFRFFSQVSREGVCVHDGKAILDCNDVFLRLFGYDRDEMIGLPIFSLVSETGAQSIRQHGLHQQEQPYQTECQRRDGSTFWGELVGRAANWRGISVRVGMIRDLTEQKGTQAALHQFQTELAAARQLREEKETWLEAVLQQSPVGIIIADPSRRPILRNNEVSRIWRHNDLPSATLAGYEVYSGFRRGTREALRPEEWPIARSILKGETVLGEEIDILRGDGSTGTIVCNSAPIRRGEAIIAGIVVFSDVTERAIAERQREVLIRELNHRVKNTLAVVQSLATHSFRGVPDTDEPRRTFEGRLQALSRAHDLLTTQGWEGARLGEVVATALGPFMAPGRFSIAGVDDVLLTNRMATTLSLALNELATNATKYGALCVAGGRVVVSWRVDNDEKQLTMTWAEENGPSVVPPQSRGFGLRLLTRSLEDDFHASVDLEFKQEGVCCRVVAPLAVFGEQWR